MARTSASGPTAFETALIAGGILLFLAMLYEMQTFLSPPLLGAAGVILLWPLRGHRSVRAMLYSGGFLLALWFITELSGVLLPFAIVYLLAFLFDPLVSKMDERYDIHRWLSSLLVTLVTLGALVLMLVLLVPNIAGQIRTLLDRLVGSAGAIQTWLIESTFLDRLETGGFVDKDLVIEQVTTTMQQQASALVTNLPDMINSLLASIGSVFGAIALLAIVPILLFYMLKDYPHIHKRMVELFPTFGGKRDYLVKTGTVVGSYLRGILLICIIAGVNVSVALVLLDVPFGLLIGILAGLLTLIPNLGAVIVMILGLMIAAIFGQPWYIDAAYVAGVLLAQSLLETTVLSPNILSYQVGIHPILVLLSLFVFGFFLGVFGLLIAVPTTALLMTFYKAYRDDWRPELLAQYRTQHSVANRLRQWRQEQKESALDELDRKDPDADQ